MNADQIQDGIDAIRETIGDGEFDSGVGLATDDNPCGAVVYHDADAELPWRIADDWTTESYRTVADAVAAAPVWRDGAICEG